MSLVTIGLNYYLKRNQENGKARKGQIEAKLI